MSLTLTPLMCARLLKERGHGAKKTWMERVIGGVEKRVLGVYGRSLWWFLRHRWVSPLIWVVCLAGTIWLFMLVPKAFLPSGDSSVIFGVFIAQRGLVAGADAASPGPGRRRCCTTIRTSSPTFTMTGNGAFLPSNQGITFTFLEAARTSARRSQNVAGEMMGKLDTIPGVFTFLRPFPVLEISTGRDQPEPGQYAFTVSGVNPEQVYETGREADGASSTRVSGVS